MQVSGQLRAPAALLPGKEHPVLIGQAGWAPELVWKRWRREKSYQCPCREFNSGITACSL